jgi:hypothetical protein
MLKINRCLLGLALVGGIVSLTASPVRAESKISQCKRFSQTMNAFSQKLIPALNSVKKSDREQVINSLDQVIAISGKGLTQIQARKFTDKKIQSVQNQVLSIYTDLHNSVVQVTNAADQSDWPAVESAVKKMKALGTQEDKIRRQFNQYCNAK